ncbi:MAG: ECF transporter S component [Rubrobacter sp.]|nr:ECF transporter S component [Rubrobacter sp.]
MASGTGDERGSATSFGTRQIVVAGVLGGIAVFLGATRLGFIPVPNLAGSATVMHIPAVVGGALEGPVVGLLAGSIFGVFSFLQPEVPLFANPIIAIGPRLLIGVVAWAVFVGLRGISVDLAAAVSGVLGSLTNTVGVLGLAVIFGYLPPAAVVAIIPQAIAEAILAAVVTVVVVRGVLLYRSGRTTAPEIEPDEEKRY